MARISHVSFFCCVFLSACLDLKTVPKIDASGPNRLEIEFPLIWTYDIDFRDGFEGLRPFCLAPRRGKKRVFFSPRDPRQVIGTQLGQRPCHLVTGTRNACTRKQAPVRRHPQACTAPATEAPVTRHPHPRHPHFTTPKKSRVPQQNDTRNRRHPNNRGGSGGGRSPPDKRKVSTQ